MGANDIGYWVLTAIGGISLFALAFLVVAAVRKTRVPFSAIRAVGIILIVASATGLALAGSVDPAASLALLGGVAGYLFGAFGAQGDNVRSVGEVTGTGNTVAAGDLHQTIEKLNQRVDTLLADTAVLAESQRGEQESGRLLVEVVTVKVGSRRGREYLGVLDRVASSRTQQGWVLVSASAPFSSHLNDFDSTLLLFSSSAERGFTSEIDAQGVSEDARRQILGD